MNRQLIHKRKLNQLETLMNSVNTGLQQEVPKGDSTTLKSVLGHIHKVIKNINKKKNKIK